MSEEAPLLNDEADHPHDIVLEHLKGRVEIGRAHV